MSKFKSSEFEIGSEKAGGRDVRVVKSEQQQPMQVRSFEMAPLASAGRKDYAEVKSRFGAFAATDADRRSVQQKDKRFSLHELVRGPLSVEEEERRAIEERVNARVSAVQEEAKAKAFDVGYQDGLKKGYEEAYRQFQQEGAARLQKLDAFLSEAESAKTEIFRANERFLMELVYRIGRMITLRELSTDREYVLRLARELIERVGVRDNITLRVHPGEKETIGMLKEGLEKAIVGMKNLEIEASSQVNQGGCILETEWNAIDASVQTQLDAIYQSLIGDAGSSSA